MVSFFDGAEHIVEEMIKKLIIYIFIISQHVVKSFILFFFNAVSPYKTTLL